MSDDLEHSCLYLIDINWMKKLIEYLVFKGQHPGSVENKTIEKLRISNFSIVLGRNVVVVTKDLWDYIFSLYLGGPCLKWVVFEDEAIIETGRSDKESLIS